MTSPFTGQPGEAMPRPGMDGATGGGRPQVAVAVVDSSQEQRAHLSMQLGQGATPFASINDLADPRLPPTALRRVDHHDLVHATTLRQESRLRQQEGADGGGRTRTLVRAQGPKPCVSASSTTSA